MTSLPSQVNSLRQRFCFLLISDLSIDANDQATIKTAMNTLMYAVGTPIEGQSNRQACVYFRPANDGDAEVLKIKYGNGCSANVS